jgi:hypothetical protein
MDLAGGEAAVPVGVGATGGSGEDRGGAGSGFEATGHGVLRQ